MGLTLTKVSEDATTITLGWTPTGNMGYVFYADGVRVSWTADPSRSSVKFSKGATEYRVVSLLRGEEGAYPSQQADIKLPGTKVTLQQGQVAAWMTCDSPSTQIKQPDNGARDRHRIVDWGPNGIYHAKLMYAVFGVKMVDGVPGRFSDWHNLSGFSSPSGVSPFAIDHFGSQVELVLQSEGDEGRPYHFQILSQSEAENWRSKWLWLWLKVTWGRRDLPVKGATSIWIAGENTPRVNVSNVNTHWPNQTSVTLWEGAYWSGNGAPQRVVVDLAATRIGTTSSICYADDPHIFVREPAGSPGGTAVATPDVDGNVPIPPNL